MIKEELYRCAWIVPPRSVASRICRAYCHFPKFSEEYFKQITTGQLVTEVVRGYRRTEWQKIRDRYDLSSTRRFISAVPQP
jgi:hypothetical protein